MIPLTDRQRVEIAVPARLVFGLVAANCFGPDPKAEDQEEAKAQVAEKSAQLRELVLQASVDPVSDLPDREALKVARRVERLVERVTVDFDQQPAVKVAMCLYYFIEDLLQSERLILWEGSAMGEALSILLPMFEYGFEREQQDASARKQARRLLEKLQKEGFYR